MTNNAAVSWDSVNLKNITMLGMFILLVFILFSDHKVTEIPIFLGMVLKLGSLWIVVGAVFGCVLGIIIAFLIDDTGILLPDGHYVLFSKKLALIGAVSAPIIWAAILISS